MNDIVLEAKNISKSFTYPQTLELLKEISLKVRKKQSIAIMGASGEGKTTLLHILGTLEKKDVGSIEIANKDVDLFSFAKIRNEHIGFIFQSFNLIEDLTAIDNVLIPAKIARKSTKKNSSSYKRAIYLLELVGLKNRIHYPAKLLSGGEKQRVGIARALCNDPEIIIADEPSGNLDHAHSLNIHKVLLQCVKELDKALIVATHDKELASLCDEIFVLKERRLYPQKTANTTTKAIDDIRNKHNIKKAKNIDELFEGSEI